MGEVENIHRTKFVL